MSEKNLTPTQLPSAGEMDDFDKAFGYLPEEQVEQIRSVAHAIGADVQTIRPFIETKQSVAPRAYFIDRPGRWELRIE